MSAITTVFGVTRREQVSPARLAALGALGLVAVVVGLAIGLGDVSDRLEAATRFVNAFGLSLYVPVVALVFASASLGDPAEDGSLVYLWLRPVARWRIVAGAWLATMAVAAPMALLPLVVAAVASRGGGDLVWGTGLATVVGLVAYTGIFTWLGLRTRRALVWGLAYILLWEGFVALAGDTAARLAVRSYTRSILAEATGESLRLATIDPTVAVVVPVLVGLAGLALATARLRRMEVP